MGMLDIQLNNVGSGQGFLIAPSSAQVFAGTLSLRIVSGTDTDVTLRTSSGSVGTVFFDQPSIHITSAATDVTIHASGLSNSVNDTVIEVVESGNVIEQFSLTVIQNPVLRFAGRFQCRLATDPDPYDSPWGLNSSFGMYAVQGSDPAHPAEPPLDRIVRLHDPVAQRPFCEGVGATVTAIESLVGNATATFKTGDAVIGVPVRLGPNCVFDSRDGNFANPGFEPIGEFEFHVGTVFFGRSAAAVPRNGSDPPGSTAPYADGLFRLDEVGPWKPGDFGYLEPTWAAHANAVTTKKIAALQSQSPQTPAETSIRDRRLKEHSQNLSGIRFAMRLIERYSGLIDRDINIDASNSAVLANLKTLSKFAFRGEFFNFDTDAQCGNVTGTLGGA
jgi:hypothetical protein